MTSLTQPLGQALTPKKSNLAPALLLMLGIVIALGAATYGFLEGRRTEKVVIAVRDVPFGHQLTADDLGTIELPLHRPIQLAGLAGPDLVLGKWATRQIGPNDLFQPTMLSDVPPDRPVYPSGQQLDKDTVPVPFSTQTIGPLSERDLVNVGYNSVTGDPTLCRANGGSVETAPEAAPNAAVEGATGGQPFACRLLQRVKVLYVDESQRIAYLQMTPYQSHTIWALQAAQVQLWGERYGATSDELPAMDRLDAAQIDTTRLTLSVSDTLKLLSPEGMGGALPGETSAIPGEQPIPTATPAVPQPPVQP